MHYTELQVTSNFSFLRGASHPEELVDQAIHYGYKKIAITDRNTLAGIVRAHSAARGKGVEIIPAARRAYDCQHPDDVEHALPQLCGADCGRITFYTWRSHCQKACYQHLLAISMAYSTAEQHA